MRVPSFLFMLTAQFFTCVQFSFTSLFSNCVLSLSFVLRTEHREIFKWWPTFSGHLQGTGFFK